MPESSSNKAISEVLDPSPLAAARTLTRSGGSITGGDAASALLL